jgi:hypothetical protein
VFSPAAGTGEPWVIRPDDSLGDGICKSTDAASRGRWRYTRGICTAAAREAVSTARTMAGRGLPPADKVIGNTAVQVAPSDSARVCALIQEETPRFYRSDDLGNTSKIVNQEHILNERSPYSARARRLVRPAYSRSGDDRARSRHQRPRG